MSGSSSMIRTLCNLIPSVKLHRPGQGFAAARRDQNREAAAAPRRALKLNFALVRFDDVLDQRQPEATAFGVMHQARADAIELLEDLLLFRARDANPLIDDLNRHESIAPAQAHADLLDVVGILHGVV